MLSNREKLILKAIVEDYIDTMEPVGSKVLTEKPYLNFSSATIRYDMQDLEEKGYLEKTHTSSGRIPSEKGFKYYVDNLVTRDESICEVFPLIDNIFNNKYLSKEEIVRKVIEFISEYTGCLCLALGTSQNFSTVKKMEIVPLSKEHAVLLIVTNLGAVQSQVITIPDGYKMDDLLRLIDMFDNAVYDHSIYEINQILTQEAMKPRIRKMVDFRDDILNFMIKAFSRFQNQERYSAGLTKIFNQPEFYLDHESMAKLLAMVDDDTLMNALKDCGQGLMVRIGSDNQMEGMKNCSIISIPYYMGNEINGAISIIGPMRMQYKKIFPLLEYVSSKLSKMYKG